MNAGEIRYMTRCIDKLGFEFQGDESLLDIGCGDGRVARLLAERVGAVRAVDVIESQSWKDGDGVAFEVADGEALPFEDASFDIVHSKDSLHHMAAPERAISEYRRVLRPGGTALIVEANRHNPSLYVQMTIVRGHDHFTTARFHDLVERAFPGARYGAFEAHYVPGADHILGLQHRVEEGVEKLSPVQALLAYNFAVAPG